MKRIIFFVLFLLLCLCFLYAQEQTDQSRFMGGERNDFIIGFFYGTIFFFILYNIILFVSLKEKSYIYHAAFLSAAFLLLFFKEGIFYNIIGFRFSSAIHSLVDNYIEFQIYFVSILFMRSVLVTKKISILYDRILISLIIFDIIIGIIYTIMAPLFNMYWLSEIISPLFGIIHSIILITTMIIFYKKNPLVIRLLFIASLIMVLGVWIQVFQAYEFLPYGIFFIDYAFYLGTLSFIFFSSMSISVQMKNLRQERDRHMAKLMQVDKMVSLGTLASSVAHEISNPNSAISSNISFIKKIYPHIEERLSQALYPESETLIGGLHFSLIKEKMTQGLSGIAASSQKIETIINEMRNFYRSAEFEQSQPIKINNIVDSALNLLRLHLQSAHISVKIELMFSKSKKDRN